MSPGVMDDLRDRARRSVLLRMLFMGFLVLVLQIPILTIEAVPIAVMLIVLYVFLFVLLHVQDYALLVGSLGLFVVLALLMYATRKVDWYQVGRPAPSD